jgi:TRAP-type mannitol/chloroaromatic compound transport system permease small subunit
MKRIADFVENGLEKICEIAAYIPMVIFCIITYEVIARYFFDSPTSWAWVITQHLFLVVCLFGGIYAFVKNSHIRIEMLYDNFSQPFKIASKLLSLALFLIFMGIFVWKSLYMAGASISGGEVARGAFAMPIYPFKALMPLAGFLLLLQGIISILKDK